MNAGEIIKDSLKYPFSDWKDFLVLGILAVLSGIFTLSAFLGAKDSVLIGFLGITGCLCVVLICGYSFKILESSLSGVTGVPEFNDWNKMFIDGIKVIIVNIAYLIPVILIILYSRSDLGIILTSLSNLNLDLLLYEGISHFIPPIALLYLIMVIPVILMAVANMADNDGKLRTAFKFERRIDTSKYWDDFTWQRMVLYNDLILVIMGVFMLYEIFEQICNIGWDKLLIWYIATGIVSLTLILVGYFAANITSILILQGLGLYSLLNYNILQILTITLVLLPYLIIFLSRSTALIYNSAIKSYLTSENYMRSYQLPQK